MDLPGHFLSLPLPVKNNSNFKQISSLTYSLGPNSPLPWNGEWGIPLKHCENHQMSLRTFRYGYSNSFYAYTSLVVKGHIAMILRLSRITAKQATFIIKYKIFNSGESVVSIATKMLV